MENVNAFLDLQDLVVKSFAKKDIGDKTAINHANAIVLILYVILDVDVFVGQDIEVIESFF